MNAGLEVVTVEREPSLVAFARKHLPKNVRVEEAEIEAYLRNAAAKGKKADFIFMDLDKPMYASCYEIIMQEGLLAPGGLLYEKIEGMALMDDGDVYVCNDNDGVDDNSGETQLLNVGNIL